ncbi:MAG: phosphate acyltransferase [Anaerolineaceae bacterium]|nr:phosphate acyltransferase [Anaerolineaceae bacterium]
MNTARRGPLQRIVFPEGEQTKIIRAAARVQEEQIGTPILLGREDLIRNKIDELGLKFSPRIINPLSLAETERREYAHSYYELRKRKGISPALAHSQVASRRYFGLMLLQCGGADAFLGGLSYEYPQIVRPALQIFHTRPGVKRASGLYLIVVKGRLYLFTDATVNIDPNAETLAEIALLAAEFAETMEMEARVALLSFSNFGSTPHPHSRRVQEAVQILHQRKPELVVDGEMQADTAVVQDIIEDRFPFSRVKDANVLVFPDLQSANIAYKLLSRLGDAEAIGPVLLGMGAPVHVLQAGDDVEDIVAMAAVAAMDAQGR